MDSSHLGAWMSSVDGWQTTAEKKCNDVLYYQTTHITAYESREREKNHAATTKHTTPSREIRQLTIILEDFNDYLIVMLVDAGRYYSY